MKRVFYNDRLLTEAGYKITRYREQNKMDQVDLAELLGYDQTYISHIEIGTAPLTRFVVDRVRWHCEIDLTEHLLEDERYMTTQAAEITFDLLAIERITLKELATLLSVKYSFVLYTMFRVKKQNSKVIKRFTQLLKETFPEYATQIDISLSVA